MSGWNGVQLYPMFRHISFDVFFFNRVGLEKLGSSIYICWLCFEALIAWSPPCISRHGDVHGKASGTWDMGFLSKYHQLWMVFLISTFFGQTMDNGRNHCSFTISLPNVMDIGTVSTLWWITKTEKIVKVYSQKLQQIPLKDLQKNSKNHTQLYRKGICLLFQISADRPRNNEIDWWIS